MPTPEDTETIRQITQPEQPERMGQPDLPTQQMAQPDLPTQQMAQPDLPTQQMAQPPHPHHSATMPAAPASWGLAPQAGPVRSQAGPDGIPSYGSGLSTPPTPTTDSPTYPPSGGTAPAGPSYRRGPAIGTVVLGALLLLVAVLGAAVQLGADPLALPVDGAYVLIALGLLIAALGALAARARRRPDAS